MSTTEIRDALHAVADSTTVPVLDRTALQRRVARERRAVRAVRAFGGLGVAAAAVLLVSVVGVPLAGGGDGGGGTTTEQASPAPAEAASSQAAGVAAPLPYLRDDRLHVLDPQGVDHELGLDVEAVLGSTEEFVYVLDGVGDVRRFDAVHGDEGPGSPWTFEEVDSSTPQAVTSARLSGDGRFLGWIDGDGRLVVRDLLAGTTTSPVDLPDDSHLSDVAQGSGAALVSQDGDLVLHRDGGQVAVRTAADGYGQASTASRERVAVVDRDAVTRVYDVSSGAAELVGEVPGSGYLSPYGDRVASLVLRPGGAARALLWTPSGASVELPVEGRPVDVAWSGETTVVVVSDLADGSVVQACDVGGRPSCRRLPVEGEDLTLAR